jgi:hypothetical protein
MKKKQYVVKTVNGYVSHFVKDVQMSETQSLRGAWFVTEATALKIAYWLIKNYKDPNAATIELVC